jgi:hypothetical protein
MSRIARSPHPFEHFTIDLLNATDDDLREVAETLGLGLNLDELRYIRDHYLIQERKTTDVELQTFDQTLSEHCSHKTFAGVIHTPEGTVNGLLKTYLRRLIDELEPDWCYSVFEDNAGIVDLTDDVGIAIKVETPQPSSRSAGPLRVWEGSSGMFWASGPTRSRAPMSSASDHLTMIILSFLRESSIQATSSAASSTE